MSKIDIVYDKHRHALVFVINSVLTYDVELDTIRSRRELCDWVDHLAEKPWFTLELMRTFLGMVRRYALRKEAEGCVFEPPDMR